MTAVPYLASLRWYRGETPVPTGKNDRRINRATIGSSDNAVLLTVPIEGGATAIKRLDPSEWTVSEHGRWRHVHWGAIYSVYGKAPFFNHYAGGLKEIIDDESIKSFADLTGKIDAFVRKSVGFSKLSALLAVNDMILRGVASEMQSKADKDMPLLHYLMKLGSDTLFLLM